MKKLLVIPSILFLIPMIGFGQVTKEREVVGNAGEVILSGGLEVSWTVGEVAVDYSESANLIVSDGFQQTDYLTTEIGELKTIEGITVYPNPVEDQLNFEIASHQVNDLRGEIIDANGKVVIEIEPFKAIDGYHSQLDVSQLPPGQWVLVFRSTSEAKQRTFSIVKIR
ncbi:T9SS type A sorting domain-containing protein [Crocinitomicaceae bacterium]|nr:T9SS type A sorting domain-containing protein [Crocinitomicaceae bacterium]